MITKTPITKFKNTEEALLFGLTHKEDIYILSRLMILRHKYLLKANRLQLQDKDDMAICIIVKAQFFREALEAAVDINLGGV